MNVGIESPHPVSITVGLFFGANAKARASIENEKGVRKKRERVRHDIRWLTYSLH